MIEKRLEKTQWEDDNEGKEDHEPLLVVGQVNVEVLEGADC